MIISSTSEDFWIARSVSACWELSGLRINIFAKPMIPFSGVRISWLMFARNSLLALLA